MAKEKLANTVALRDLADTIGVVLDKNATVMNKDAVLAYIMRACNCSYSEIGEALGTSRQYAHQLVEVISERTQP